MLVLCYIHIDKALMTDPDPLEQDFAVFTSLRNKDSPTPNDTPQYSRDESRAFDLTRKRRAGAYNELCYLESVKSPHMETIRKVLASWQYGRVYLPQIFTAISNILKLSATPLIHTFATEL